MPSNLINKKHLREVLMSTAASGSDRPPSYHLALLHVAMAFGVNIDEAPTQPLGTWRLGDAISLELDAVTGRDE